MPPLYQSTGMKCLKFSICNFQFSMETGFLNPSLLKRYARKYHDEPAQLGITSVSLLAFPLHFGHFVFTQFVILARGDSPSGPGSYFSTSGNSTGKSFSGTGTTPHFLQCTTGIGSPQYLCLENTQSRNLYLIIVLPNFSVIFSRASCEVSPVNSPESNRTPSSTQACGSLNNLSSHMSYSAHLVFLSAFNSSHVTH